MPNNKKHWGDVISSLGDADAVDLGAAEKDAAAPVKQNSETEKGKTEKKRAARSNASRKRGDAKKERVAESAAFERDLLTSHDSEDPKLDLTVGEAEKKEKRPRRRTKKSDETGLAEKAIAEEEKKERAKRKRLADAIVEKAKEPFQNLASQIEGRIQELVQEETESGSEENQVKKPRKTSSRRKKKSELSVPAAEPAAEIESAAADLKAEPVSGDFWAVEESLEISWGRSPKRSSAVSAETPAAEDLSEVSAEPSEEEKPQPAKKLSRRDAEDKFASLFEEKQVSEDEISDFKKRSSRSRNCRGEEPEVKSAEPAPAAKSAASLDDNSFWGIPDEPEIGFVSRAQKESKTERKESKPQHFDSREPEQVPASPSAERNERGERRGGDRENRRSERSERSDVSRQERGGHRSENVRSDRYSEEAISEPGTEKAFPTWNDAIGDLIRHNIGRHSGGSRGGERKRR